MNKQAPITIGESVMRQIKSGSVRMRPRSYYALLGGVSIVATLLAGITIAYLSSIVFFWIRVITADTMAYGARANLSASISSFPWWALVLAIGLTVVAVVLVRKQGRMYRHKTSTILVGIVACSLVLGFGLSFLEIGRWHTPNQVNEAGQGQGWQRNR